MIFWKCPIHDRVFDGKKGCPVGNKSSKKSCEVKWRLDHILTTSQTQTNQKQGATS